MSLPRFRVHRRTGKDGAVWTSYWWDGRGRGMRDIPLGTDLEAAKTAYLACERGEYPELPKQRPKRLKMVKKGQRRVFGPETWGGVPDWAKRFYLNAEKRCLDDRKPFTLSIDDLRRAIARAEGKCEVTGVPFEGTGKSPFAPSIDRIDSRRGYEASNIRVVCLLVNYAMNTWGEAPLLALIDHALRKRLENLCESAAATTTSS